MGLVSYLRNKPQNESLLYAVLTWSAICRSPAYKKIDQRNLELLSDKSFLLLLPFRGNSIENISAPFLCYGIFKDIELFETFTLFSGERINTS